MLPRQNYETILQLRIEIPNANTATILDKPYLRNRKLKITTKNPLRLGFIEKCKQGHSFPHKGCNNNFGLRSCIHHSRNNSSKGK